MSNFNELKENYLQYCQNRKRLDAKTIRAYRSDLNDYANYLNSHQGDFLYKQDIGNYIEFLHLSKAPRTVRRRVASLQAFYHYLMYEEILSESPLSKLDLSFKLPQQLPRYVPNHILNMFFKALYEQKNNARTKYQSQCAVRNIAIIELLFATGLRISELCGLTTQAVNLIDREIRIRGKGDKERILQLTEEVTINALIEYEILFHNSIISSGYFFVNGHGNHLSDQSVRNMIHKIEASANLHYGITPHMFRHSFATSLVNQDVDIRCIQEMLGHSSIKTTEIYTHVRMTKQKKILETKNPRKLLEQ